MAFCARENVTLLLILLMSLSYSFSAPWPETVGVPEIVTGVFLFLVSLKPFLFYFRESVTLVWAIFVYLLIFPLAINIFYQWHFNDIIRDYVPLLYIMFSFVMVKEVLKWKEVYIKIFYKNAIFFLIVVGVSFSIKGIYEIISHGGSLLLIGKAQLVSPHYYPQSPAVIFTSIFSLLYAIYGFEYKKHSIFNFILLFISLVCISSIVSHVYRALICFFVLSLGFYIFKKLSSFRKRKITIGLIVSVFVLMFACFSFEIIISIITLVYKKTLQAGTTGKIDEVFYALKFIGQDLFRGLFGIGWGGLWNPPSCGGDIYVSYAHSLLSYAILKLGLIGFVIFLLFIVYYLKICIYIYLNSEKGDKITDFSFIIFLSANAALIDNIFLEPGYKTLDFAFVFMLYLLTYELLKKRRVWCIPDGF